MPGRPLVVLLGPLAEPEASQLPPGADVLAPVSSLALDRLAERGGGRFRILDIRALLAPRIEAIRDAFVRGMARLAVTPIGGAAALEARLARGATTDWWLLEPSQRNPESSPVFEAVCLADVTATCLRSRAYDRLVLVGGDPETVAMFRTLAAQAAVPSEHLGRPPRAGPTALGLAGRRIRAFVRLAAKKWIVRRWPVPPVVPGAVAFQTWCPVLWSGAAADAADRCFVDVPERVADAGVGICYAATFDGVTASRDAMADAVRRVDALPDRVRRRLVFVERLGSWRELAAALMDVRAWWHVHRALSADPTWLSVARLPSGVDPAPLLARELRYAAAVQLPVLRVLQGQMRAFARRVAPSRVVITMETYCYGRAVMTGLRDAASPPRVIGLQHSPGSRNQLFYRFEPDELTRARPVPVPDLFALHSEVIANLLAGAGVPATALALTGAPRSAALTAYRDGRRHDWAAIRARHGWPDGEAVVLLAATIFPEETARLLEFTADAIAAVEGWRGRLVIKAHPLNPNLDAALAELARRYPSLHIESTVISLPALLAGADLFVTGNSTSDIEALAIGCPVVRVASAMIDVSPTGDHPGAVPWVADRKALGALLRSRPAPGGEVTVAAALGPMSSDVSRRVADAVMRA